MFVTQYRARNKSHVLAQQNMHPKITEFYFQLFDVSLHASMLTGELAFLIACLADSDSSER